MAGLSAEQKIKIIKALHKTKSISELAGLTGLHPIAVSQIVANAKRMKIETYYENGKKVTKYPAMYAEGYTETKIESLIY